MILLKEIALKIIEEQSNSINIKTTPVKELIDILDQSLFRKLGYFVSDTIPNLEQNLSQLKTEVKNSFGIDRNKMPVIKKDQVDDFNKAMMDGKIDVVSPFAKGHLYLPDHFQNNERGREWLMLGMMDGDRFDDVIRTKLGYTSVDKLHPIQGEVWLDVIIENALKYGLELDTKSKNATIIISEDNYILDGHHRWARQYMLDPKKSLRTLMVPINTATLIDICRNYGIAIGNKFNQ